MRITAVRLFNVRRFAGEGVALEGIGEGVNLIVAANEHGKSTTFDALHALFFQAHTSRAAAVQALKPYAGGSPVVEVDIDTAAGRFRLSKRFLARPAASVIDRASGRLLAQADEAEAFIAALIRGGTAGPAGLLWVRQGLTGLDRRAKAEEDQERSARESVLASVQGEVEAITGGRRMQEVQKACATDLGRLVTETGKPKAGGPYHQALQAAEEARAEEARLRRDVESLHDELARRRAARARLAEIEAPAASEARRVDLADAERVMEAAKARAAEIRLAEAEAGQARIARDQALSALAARRDEEARLSEALRRRQLSEARLKAAAAREAEVSEASRSAAARLEADEREAAEAKALLARLDRALAARDRAERRREAAARLAQAEAARSEAEACAARLKAAALPDGAVAAIEAAELRRAEVRAAAAATAPRLTIAYEPGAEGRISLDGVVLGQGEAPMLGAEAVITIAGIGRLAFHGGPRTGDAALAAADAALTMLFERHGVDSLAEARRREEAARAARADLDKARALLAALAPQGLEALRIAAAAMTEEEPAAEPPEADPAAARAAVDAVEARLAESRQAARAIGPLRDDTVRTLAQAEAALPALDGEIAALSERLGPEALRADRGAALAAAAAEREAAAAAAEARLTALSEAGIDEAAAQARLARARSVAKAAEEEAARLRGEIAGLDMLIADRSEEAVEEAWREAEERRQAAEARAEGFAREVAALTRLSEALAKARADAREHYFGPVMREMKPLMRLLFDDAEIVFDDETLQPSRVTRRGQEERIDVLSGGTREQLAILTRLAFARLLASDGRAAPVILDDALVYSDDDRIERMFDALHHEARDQQIIVLSCRQRAFARLGGHALAYTPWTPAGA